MSARIGQVVRRSSTSSSDGTVISYLSVGNGPALILVGGALGVADDYLPLAGMLADSFQVHVVNRRGRGGSGPMRVGHSIEEECHDLAAVSAATGARTVFGHSFGGLVALESARRAALFDRIFVYEPGVPLRGQLRLHWVDGYAERLGAGRRRAAFAWMVKHNGFAPPPISLLPVGVVETLLRLGFRGTRWTAMDELLEANLAEHKILAAVDSPTAARFASITARTILLGGAKSPAALSASTINELAATIPNATARLIPGLRHTAPQHRPNAVAAAIGAASCGPSTAI